MEWLNRNVLIGQTDKRGTAWHHRADLQGDEPNHYPGFIPVGDVQRRLFGFEQVPRKVGILVPDVFGTVDVDGVAHRFVLDDAHMAVADDDDTVLGIHASEYAVHTFNEWLLDNMATILDDTLGISSAGLLRKRRQAWVEVSMPENVDTPEGVTFRPNLLAFTSHDSTLSTTYKRTIGLVVCDNTLAARIGEDGQEVRYRHTSGSITRVAEAREALGIIYSAAEDFQTELTVLCNTTVTDAQWQKVLDAMFPYPRDEATGKVVESGRSFTMAANKRESVDQLYRYDVRCQPWTGTKFGVVQAFNTWKTHKATARNTYGGGRPERIMANVIGGQGASFDALVSDAVDKVLAPTG
jgi:phage/plasmid-like protein (TIGR03299 family)